MSKSNNSPFKMVVMITLIVVALFVALVILNNRNSDSNHDTTFDQQPPIEGQPMQGNSDAPVTVVEFGDFKCPSCKIWGETIYPKLISDYVDTGKVKFSYINVLFHGEESKLGSLAAESVYKESPNSYWKFHKELFNAQPNENHDGLWITNEKILEIAKTIPGIDTQQLQKDLENESGLAEVNKDAKLVEEFKIQFTPSIMVNGTMLEDPFDYDQMKSLIEKELEGN
ncbi:DsbA family protein [Oikeobacillus pervagus]|nr:DsbA family protein [Oikeobacillus pervagus]